MPALCRVDETHDNVAMRELPNGTVTLFFTDIEGSTRLLIELGDRYAEVLAHHRRLMREAFATHGGVEVDTQGDAFFVVFARPQDAVAAAADAQRAHAGRPIRVRIGIHTGTPTLTEEGYAGLDVHRAARVMAAGHGGQVLVSQTTCDLLDGTFGMRDLGEHRLKDLTAPQRLYQLLIEGLPVAFPALKTLEGRPTNLPVQPSPLIGREGELAEVCFLLRRNDVRLLTLTGPGGSGKTRLALQAAAELLDEHEGGTFFVGLAPVTEPELVVPTIAQTLGLREWPGRTISETLRDYLERKTVLLLLDNLEQVVDAASAIGDLLASCPKLSILATSREPLRLAAEREYPVDPLSSDDAVALFTERARTAKPHFDLTPENEAVVREICGRLDDLPLAIELAASRVKLLPLQALRDRLNERLSLLTGGARDAPERQRTLRAAIDWSFRLLAEDEQALFARLGVFPGSFSLEAAEAITGGDLEGTASLLDKSLLRQARALPRSRASSFSRRSGSTRTSTSASAASSTTCGAATRSTSSRWRKRWKLAAAARSRLCGWPGCAPSARTSVPFSPGLSRRRSSSLPCGSSACFGVGGKLWAGARRRVLGSTRLYLARLDRRLRGALP